MDGQRPTNITIESDNQPGVQSCSPPEDHGNCAGTPQFKTQRHADVDLPLQNFQI